MAMSNNKSKLFIWLVYQNESAVAYVKYAFKPSYRWKILKTGLLSVLLGPGSIVRSLRFDVEICVYKAACFEAFKDLNMMTIQFNQN